MKNIIKNIIPAIVITLTFSGCSDWLNLEPEDGVIRQEYWKTKEHVHSAVYGCYQSMQLGVVERMFLWGELRADMVEDGVVSNNIYAEIIDGEISSSNPIVNWSNFYLVINNCNTVLKFAPNVLSIDGTFTQKQWAEYKAEVLTIRAMMYYYLVRSFKDVPLILEAYTSDDQDLYIPKTSSEIILDSIVKDLQFATNNAPVGYTKTTDNKSRITRWSAKTLLADVYLWMERYQESLNLCNEVIGSGKFSMIPVEKMNYEVMDGGNIIDVVTVASEADAESFFSQSYVEGNSVESIFEIPFSSLYTNPFYELLGPQVNDLKPKIDILDEGIFPAPVYSAFPDATDIRGSGCSYRAGVVWKYVGMSRTGSPRAATEYTSPWIIYKYSDVLLMKAEALNQIGLKTSGEQVQDIYKQAIQSMNIVRKARNAVETSDYKFVENEVDGKILEKAILDERAREFSFEGKRWYDVLRNAKRNDYEGSNIQYLITLAINSTSPQKQQSLIAKYKDPKHNSHYWPIYIKEIESNKNLKQNEFYAK